VLYHWYELSHVAVKPARAAADTCRMLLDNPFNPMSHTALGRHTSAACEVFERTTRRYDKPSFGIEATEVDGASVAVNEVEVWRKPFCRLVHFERGLSRERCARDPQVLLVAPMSGHFATLLRGTVETLLPDHDVYITDWQDARDVPMSAGRFDLDDYIDYIIEMLSNFGGDVHVFAVCQPSVPVLAATAVMEAEGNPNAPASVILAGGPIDTRISPTVVNELAEERGTAWFEQNVISIVPFPNMGAGRFVYPGFLQLTGFMTMNLDRHLTAHQDLFLHLVEGDGDSAEKHRTFYDEYLAVMDLTEEFYLQTIETVFVRHSLAKGEMMHRGRPVDLSRIKNVALMTLEGEKDDITGLGQCRAAHNLVSSLPDRMRYHFQASGVGHYGVFNGSKFRNYIAPRITQFIRTHDARADQIAVTPPRDMMKATKPVTAALAAEISEIAFTFAPANDILPDRQADKLRENGLSNAATVSAGSRVHDDIYTALQVTPFRFWALAGRMMLDGVFGLSTKPNRHETAGQTRH